MASVHWFKYPANKAGLPYPYAVGMQINSWFIQFLTNWIGDEGWLKRCYAEYRGFLYISEAVWFKGQVTDKRIDENGEYCVDIETSGTNQRGNNIIPGKASVILPSRDAKTWPVKIRLPEIS